MREYNFSMNHLLYVLIQDESKIIKAIIKINNLTSQLFCCANVLFDKKY